MSIRRSHFKISYFLIYWRVFFDHTFDLLNQILLGFIRFCNSSRIPNLSCFLLVKYHQKAIQLSIRSQRRKRCGIIKTLSNQGLADFTTVGSVFFVFYNSDTTLVCVLLRKFTVVKYMHMSIINIKKIIKKTFILLFLNMIIRLYHSICSDFVLIDI